MNINKYFKEQSGIDLDFLPTSIKLSTGEIVCGYASSIDDDYLCVMTPLRLMSTMDSSRAIAYYFVEYDPMTMDVFQMFNKQHVITCNALKKEYDESWKKMVLAKFQNTELDSKNKSEGTFIVDGEPTKLH